MTSEELEVRTSQSLGSGLVGLRRIGTQEQIAGLYKKIAGVMGAMSRLEKSAYNAKQDYYYAPQEDVYDLVRKELADRGLAYFPVMVGIEDISVQGRNGVLNKTRVLFEMTLSDSDSGASISSPWYAEAQDSLDKAIAKASSQAVKYYLIRTFIISTGDDIDPDSGVGYEKGSSNLGVRQSRTDGRSKGDRSKGGNPSVENRIGKVPDMTGWTVESVKPNTDKDYNTYYTKTVHFFGIDTTQAAQIVSQEASTIRAYEYFKARWEKEQKEKAGAGEE